MFVRQDGETIGTISGGCLEADVIERGWELTASGRPALIRYDSRGEDDLADWGFGLGCNGAIDVLLERVDSAHPPEYLIDLKRSLNERRSVVLATVFGHSSDAPVTIGHRLVLDNPYSVDRSSNGPQIDDAAREALLSRVSSVQDVPVGDGHARVFFELVEPPPHLLVCGAGHDAMPLVRLASVMGWSISVCDRRESLATPERFPQADAVHAVSPEQTLAALKSPPDALVIMTHRYPEDLKLLRVLLDSSAAYVGVLGPRHRTDRLLQAAGISAPPAPPPRPRRPGPRQRNPRRNRAGDHRGSHRRIAFPQRRKTARLPRTDPPPRASNRSRRQVVFSSSCSRPACGRVGQRKPIVSATPIPSHPPRRRQLNPDGNSQATAPLRQRHAPPSRGRDCTPFAMSPTPRRPRLIFRAIHDCLERIAGAHGDQTRIGREAWGHHFGWVCEQCFKPAIHPPSSSWSAINPPSNPA